MGALIGVIVIAAVIFAAIMIYLSMSAAIPILPFIPLWIPQIIIAAIATYYVKINYDWHTLFLILLFIFTVSLITSIFAHIAKAVPPEGLKAILALYYGAIAFGIVMGITGGDYVWSGAGALLGAGFGIEISGKVREFAQKILEQYE